MSALFDFKAFLTVVLLTICACTFVKARFPKLLSERTGCVLTGFLCCHTMVCADVSAARHLVMFWCRAQVPRPVLESSEDRCALATSWKLFAAAELCVIYQFLAAGERLSPWVAVACIIMGFAQLLT